jgi:hypothetical protein
LIIEFTDGSIVGIDTGSNAGNLQIGARPLSVGDLHVDLSVVWVPENRPPCRGDGRRQRGAVGQIADSNQAPRARGRSEDTIRFSWLVRQVNWRRWGRAGPRQRKVHMTLNDLLLSKGIDPQTVLVFRHRPHEPQLNKVLPWLAAEQPEVFNAYQQTQGGRVEKAVSGASYVASFIGHAARLGRRYSSGCIQSVRRSPSHARNTGGSLPTLRCSSSA